MKKVAIFGGTGFISAGNWPARWRSGATKR